MGARGSHSRGFRDLDEKRAADSLTKNEMSAKCNAEKDGKGTYQCRRQYVGEPSSPPWQRLKSGFFSLLVGSVRLLTHINSPNKRRLA